jgi:hypothetical protein
MSGYCETHDLEFNMSCPACNYELNYMNRTYLLEAFRAGVRGKAYLNSQPEYVSAWNEGLNFCKRKTCWQ